MLRFAQPLAPVTLPVPTEGWLSGRKHRLAKPAYLYGYLGFESRPLRQTETRVVGRNAVSHAWTNSDKDGHTDPISDPLEHTGKYTRSAARRCYAQLLIDKSDLLDICAAILDALAFLETLKRSPDGEHGNDGHDRERVEKTVHGVTERLQAAAAVLAEAITEES